MDFTRAVDWFPSFIKLYFRYVTHISYADRLLNGDQSPRAETNVPYALSG